jgi:hypothetical protein
MKSFNSSLMLGALHKSSCLVYKAGSRLNSCAPGHGINRDSGGINWFTDPIG